MQRRHHLVMLGPVAVAALLAAVRISDQPVYGDELFTYGFTDQSIGGLLRDLFSREANMGPYYLAFYAWRQAGDSIEWARLLSVVGGLLSVYLVGEVGRRWWNLRTGVLAALIFAVHPFALIFLTEARPYSWAVAFGLLATLAIEPHHRVRPILYGVATGLGAALNPR